MPRRRPIGGGRPQARWRLGVMGLAAFFLGAGIGLAFPVAPHSATGPAVALERPLLPADPAAASPRGFAPSLALGSEPPPAPPSRGEIARQLAFEAFLRGRARDGVSYFRIAVRHRRQAPGDEVLILQTIDALASRTAAASAASLLQQLGARARPLLGQAATAHANPKVRARAQALLGAPGARSRRGRPFLRWAR